jgi:hypothetical protein
MMQLSAHLLGRIRERESFFEHQFVDWGQSGHPRGVDIAAAVSEFDAFIVLITYRPQAPTTVLRCLLFLKREDIYKKTALDAGAVMGMLSWHSEMLERRPLLLLNVILSPLLSRASNGAGMLAYRTISMR